MYLLFGCTLVCTVFLNVAAKAELFRSTRRSTSLILLYMVEVLALSHAMSNSNQSLDAFMA